MMDDENASSSRPRLYERPYPRAYTRETMRRGDRRRKNHHTPDQSRSYVLGVQVVVTVLSLLTVLVMHTVKSPVDQTVRQALQTALTKQLSKEELSSEVSQVMKRFQIQLPNVKSVFNTTSGVISQSGSKSSSSSAVSSSSSSSSKAAASGTSKNAGAASAAATGSLSGEGGEDLSVQTAGGSLVPPSSVSLGPYLLSAQPIWPVQGRITSTFGYRINPVTHKQSFHTGMDIAAAKDTPIVAALPGVVEQAGKSADYGYFLLLDHGGGVETFYGHCDQLLVKQGARVRIGQTIAKVGSTGLSTGYHLHFEIHIDQIRVDPARALEIQLQKDL